MPGIGRGSKVLWSFLGTHLIFAAAFLLVLSGTAYGHFEDAEWEGEEPPDPGDVIEETEAGITPIAFDFTEQQGHSPGWEARFLDAVGLVLLEGYEGFEYENYENNDEDEQAQIWKPEFGSPVQIGVPFLDGTGNITFLIGPGKEITFGSGTYTYYTWDGDADEYKEDTQAFDSGKYTSGSLAAWQTDGWTPGMIIIKGASTPFQLGGDANIFDYTGQISALGNLESDATSDWWLWAPPRYQDGELKYQDISHIALIYNPRGTPNGPPNGPPDLGDLQPVTKGADPPVEGFVIESKTILRCEGNTTMKDSFTWTYGDGAIDVSLPWMLSGGAAEIRYQQNMRALHGDTDFTKYFGATSDEQPNLIVDNFLGYRADPDSLAALMAHEEKASMSNVNFGGILGENRTNILTLCPWAVSGQVLDAYTIAAAAGSKMRVKEVAAVTETRANTLFLPGLSYDVSAEGEGHIQTGFLVEVFEGAHPFVPSLVRATLEFPDLRLVNMNILSPPPPVVSRTSYQESTRADGIWDFYKTMEYQSTFPELGIMDPVGSLF